MRHIVKIGFVTAALAIVGVQYLSRRPAAARQNAQLTPAMQLPAAATVQAPQASNFVAPQSRSSQEPM